MAREQKNEGEGNRTADREYREDTQEFVKSGKVSDAAGKARDALESGEKDALKRAEEAGKKPARR
jgi:hypothetical protein